MSTKVQAEIVGKLTLKTIGCGKTAIQAATSADKENAVLLATFIGICGKVKPGAMVDPSGESREFNRLIGTFQAANNLTGEIYQSNTALLPDLVSDQIASACGPDEKEVEFAVQFLARYSEKAATNYVFSARPLLAAQPSDKMAALMEKANAQLQLSAPEPVAPAEPVAPDAGTTDATTKTNKKK